MLTGLHVGGNVLAHSCNDSIIDGNLTYVQGCTNNCTVSGTTTIQSAQIPSQPLPITQEQITTWKDEATSGGVLGNTNLTGSQKMTLGPKKINGSLTLSNNAVLTLSGTVYVTGTIVINNSAKK